VADAPGVTRIRHGRQELPQASAPARQQLTARRARGLPWGGHGLPQ
jgi:hypothetical protein